MRSFSIPEIKEIGFFDSSVHYKGITQSPKRIIHTYQLEMSIEDGGATFIDGQIFPIKKGNIIMTKPDQTRYTFFPHSCYYIHFYNIPSTLLDYLDKLPAYFSPDNKEQLFLLFKEIAMVHLFPDNLSELQLQSKILLLIALLLKDSMIYPEKIQVSAITSKAKKYINEHLTENISNEILAQAVNLSKNQLQRVFFKETRRSPHQYILEKRIEAAKRELIISNRSLSEIALLFCFSSQSHFSAVFKKAVGLTPLEYKQKNTHFDF